MMACKYGTTDKRMDPTEYFNGMTIATSEIKIEPKRTTSAGEWSVSFSKEPAKVGSLRDLTFISFSYNW